MDTKYCHGGSNKEEEMGLCMQPRNVIDLLRIVKTIPNKGVIKLSAHKLH